eukprot:1155795-Pelagomonas_calceolata.AAC.2
MLRGTPALFNMGWQSSSKEGPGSRTPRSWGMSVTRRWLMPLQPGHLLLSGLWSRHHLLSEHFGCSSSPSSFLAGGCQHELAWLTSGSNIDTKDSKVGQAAVASRGIWAWPLENGPEKAKVVDLARP